MLHDLEKQLPYQIFTLEWAPHSNRRKRNRYWKLANVEVTLPVIFCGMFVALIAYSIFN